VWAPTGLSLAALLLFGFRLWPGVAVGAFIANVTSDVSAATAAGIAVGNTLEAVGGTFLLRRIGFRAELDRVRDVLALVVLASLLATTVSATIGTVTLLASGDIQARAYGSSWLLWWFGDLIGALIVTPFLLVWARRRPFRLDPWRALEAAALLGTLGVVSWVVFFGGRWQYPYVLFPLLVWAALRFGQRGAVTAMFIVAGLGVWGSVNGSVAIPAATQTQTVQILQALVAVVAVALMTMAASLEEQGRAEAAARDSVSLLQATLESTADGILVVDAQGRMVSFNQRFLDMWRIPPEVATSRDDRRTLEFVLDQLEEPERFRTRIRDLYARADAEELDVLRFKDGRVFERYSRPQRVGGAVVGRVWSFRDVTEQRRAEDVKARFLGMATHEMRTPLAVTSGFASLLLDHWDRTSDEEKLQAIGRIGDQARRLGRLVEDLLATSQLDSGELVVRSRPLNMSQVVADVLEDFKDQPVTVSAGAPFLVVADRDHFEQMLVNYLSNAFKYGKPPYSITLAESDGTGVVRVADEGEGVPPEFVPQLFDRFSRGPSVAKAGGTGLGLAIVRELAQAQGGEAWYEPNHPKGASFCVRLPLA
jgi:PAS domain S-box-containing protein